VASAAFVVGVTMASVVALPGSASAADHKIDVNLACQTSMGSTSWGAKLVNSSSVYGWRCWNRAYPEQYWLGPFYSPDFHYHCSVVYGTSAFYAQGGNPHSWYCYD